jgi:ABC-type dipeptide/oligopeptide/nickel transport system ATPase subunit
MAAFLPVSEIAQIGRQLADTLGATRRVYALANEPIPVRDGPGVPPRAGAAALALEKVNFTYPGQTRRALSDVSFKIPAGKTVALVGTSGAGKTTTAQLLMRFWDADSGRITLNGADLRNYKLDELRRLIALVAQDTYLFNDSLRANILIARPDASEAELQAAVRHASLGDLVAALPDGLDSPVGERGTALSGGQRQRVAIARAFLKDAPILVLDEATSHLDAVNEQAVRRALDLDPAMAEAHAVMARILVHFDLDVDGSGRGVRRALELGPTNPFVLHCAGLMLADQGRFEEALSLEDRALAQDPASVLANRDRAIVLYLAGRYEEAVEQSQRTLELDRYYASAYLYLGRAYEQLNRPKEAVEAYITPLTFREENREMVAALRDAASRGGLKAFWKMRLHYLLKEPEVPTNSVATAYVRLGDHDNAIAWLERLAAERGAWTVGLAANPVWDPLRGDPRFQDLLRRSNLPTLSLPHRTQAIAKISGS